VRHRQWAPGGAEWRPQLPGRVGLKSDTTRNEGRQ